MLPPPLLPDAYTARAQGRPDTAAPARAAGCGGSLLQHWEEHVEALSAFRAAHGDCPREAVPAGGSWQFVRSDRCGRAVHISQRALRAWLAEQRRGHRRGVLRADQEEHLAALGVGWARRALAARSVRCCRTPRPARAPGEAARAGRSPRGHERFVRVLPRAQGRGPAGGPRAHDAQGGGAAPGLVPAEVEHFAAANGCATRKLAP